MISILRTPNRDSIFLLMRLLLKERLHDPMHPTAPYLWRTRSSQVRRRDINLSSPDHGGAQCTQIDGARLLHLDCNSLIASISSFLLARYKGQLAVSYLLNCNFWSK